MDFLKSINDINRLQYINNAYNAKYSNNPEEKKLADARYYCNNKLTIRSLKTVFLSILLPVILLVLFIIIGVSNSKAYIGLGIWFFGGVAYSVVRSNIDTKIAWDINHSNVTKEDCGF